MYNPLSAEILLTQGMCCGNMCANCPYLPRWEFLSTQEHEQWIIFNSKNPEKTFEEFLEIKQKNT